MKYYSKKSGKDKDIPIKLEGIMSESGADKVAVIMAWGKATAIVITSLTGLLIAVTAFIKLL